MISFKQFITENKIDGAEVLAHVKRIGTSGGLSSYLSNTIKSQTYELKDINIEEILKHDLDVKDYVDANKMRKKQGNPSEPIVIGKFNGKDNQVIDGYNRILYHVINGKSTVKGYVAI
jgi:hypothetical protein